MLKWIRGTLATALAIVVMTACAGVVYEQLGRRAAIHEFPPMGRLIRFDGKLSHVHCVGDGSPTVILESGLDIDGSQAWESVQSRIAEKTRVCSYDRAGFLWSEPRAEPRSASRIADELHGVLAAAAEAPPYVMVGHSLGGLLLRVYVDRFPNEVAGVVLVDGSHPDQFERYPPAVRRLLARVDSMRPSRVMTRLGFIFGLRRLRASAAANAEQAFLWRSIPSGYYGELAARDAMSTEVQEAPSLGDRPLIVLTAGEASPLPGIPDSVLATFYDTWVSLQGELATLSTNSLHRVVEGSSHYIQNDAPTAVIDAVGELVESVRREEPLSTGSTTTLRHEMRLSKVQAAAWATQPFPRWAGLIESALVWRKDLAMSLALTRRPSRKPSGASPR